MSPEHLLTNTSMQLTLAPLRGITDHIFRTCFQKHFGGFDSALAPFIPGVQGEAANLHVLRDILPDNNTQMPIEPQTIGNKSRDIVLFGTHCKDLGYTRFNWNLGCPFAKITRKISGSGLLPHPDIVKSILDEVVPHIPIKLSVKVRLGLHSADDLLTLIPVLNSYPLAQVTIHARTADQQYEGTVNLDAFERAADMIATEVEYNGDIVTLESFDTIKARFPKINKFMIGRGAVADPFLAFTIKQGVVIHRDEKIVRIKNFYTELYALNAARYAGSAITGKMKEWWGTIAPSFGGGKDLLKSIQRCKNQAHYEAIVKNYFEHDPEWIR